MNIDNLVKWYEKYCYIDEYSHFEIKIETIDNPGWTLKVNLLGTKLENVKFENIFIENSEHDWYSIKTENNIFCGFAGPKKLDFLIETFINFAKENEVGK